VNDNNNREINIEVLNSVDISNYPITTNAIIYPKTAILLQFIIQVASLLIPSVFILTFFESAMNNQFFHWRVLFLFIDILAWWGIYLLTSLLIGKLMLIILKLIHQPKEGIFKVDYRDRDYYFFCLRVSIKKVIFWIWNNFCFPWVSNFAFKIFNMRTDFKSTLFDGWSDAEWINYGSNIMLGQGALVASSIIIGDYLLIKKVIIGDHVVLGGNSIVAPGTIIGKGTTLGVFSVTHINQILKPGWIYIGRPARRYQLASKEKEIKKSN
jgi:hypothetical protein